MSLQINLLKKTEQRYQGIVSMKVMVFCSVSVLAGITILVFSLAGISRMTLSTNLERARREWERLDPQASAVRNLSAANAANRKTLAALDDRAQGGYLFMHSVLLELQRTVPEKMAFESLYAGVEKISDKEAPYHVLRFSGKAQGELTAVDARRTLSSNRVLSRFCGEVRLVSSQRDAGDIWLFTLEGRRQTDGGGAK